MESPQTPVLRVENISQRFGDHLALDGVSLEIEPGRVTGLLGPNGAGKTTLMRVLFGVLPPDEGNVLLGDRKATDADRQQWGYMPQERGLYRDMRVLDHLSWFGRLHGLDRRTSRDRAAELLERLGLSNRGRDPIKDLSGGMVQRVQLAAAMVHQPQLLVLDEPFSGLDPAAVASLSDVIHDQIDRGGSLVLSSHQLDLVEDICESIVLLHHGRVVLRGDLRELKARSAERYLRVDVEVPAEWLAGSGAHPISVDASGSRLHLEPGCDAAAVLDLVRAHAVVTDFGVESPTLSELFLAATGERSEVLSAGETGDTSEPQRTHSERSGT